MADKPSRGLVLYGDGLARFVDTTHSHLHSLASQSSCGFLSLPHSPPSENVDAQLILEFLNLLDAYTECSTLSVESQDKCITPTISERFMGIRAALFTENTSLKACGNKHGLSVIQANELINSNCSFLDSPINLVSMELLKLLGFQGGQVLEKSQFDLVFVHVGVGACREESSTKYMEKVNSLVGDIMSMAKPKSDIASRLHLSVIFSYGVTSKDDESIFSISNTNRNMKSDFSSLFPRQSYTMKGSNLRKNLRDYCPMLVTQCQDAVTRKDMVETFSFKDFRENGGNLIIPADRFLHEVAFKLWKAPKYGA